jgi:type I restriction enzyme R subunit
LAHRLSDLHANTDPFDKVIVMADRRNLDAQLRETVGSFSQTDGLVVKIDERYGTKSEQLARALSRDTGKIVTVTLHSFPALLDYIKRKPTEIKGTRFAIIVVEAHSSQSGDAATAVESALRDLGLDSDSEDAGATTVNVTDKHKAKAVERPQAADLPFAFTA